MTAAKEAAFPNRVCCIIIILAHTQEGKNRKSGSPEDVAYFHPFLRKLRYPPSIHSLPRVSR